MEIVVPACLICSEAHPQWFTRKNGCDIYECGTCRYRFVFPLPNTDAIYGEEYFAGAEGGFGYSEYDRDKEPMIPTFLRYLELITQYNPDARTLLDVGAATGFFVDIAAQKGFTASGIELSSFAVAQGQKQGRTVSEGTIHDLPAPTQYEVITMLDVIEHVPEPEQDIAKARSLMISGGLLMVNTPDTGSLYARLMGKRWHLLTPPEHIAYFDRKNLVTLLRRHGFEVVWVGTIGKQFTLPYVFSTLYAWQGFTFWNRLSHWTSSGLLSRIKVPINLGDNLLLIARAV